MCTPLPAERSQRLVEQLAASECPALTARRARRAELSGAPHDPIVWARASGANVWDADGNRYVDLTRGLRRRGRAVTARRAWCARCTRRASACCTRWAMCIRRT